MSVLNYKEDKEYYYLYKITNTLNDKIYYGIHGTNDLNDGYMGSGHPLSRAKKKYGLEAFKMEILEFFNTPEEMCLAEAKIVTKEFIKSHGNYNAIPGGGKPAYGKRGKSVNYSKGQKEYIKTLSKEEISKRMSCMGSKAHWTKERKDEWRRKLSLAHVDNEKYSIATLKVWQNMTEETKSARSEKIRNAKLEEYSSYTKEERRQLTAKATEAAKRKITCKYCGKIANIGNHNRWHGDNCKMRNIK